MNRDGSRLLVDCLLEHGVDTVFGVPGESYLGVLDVFHDVSDRLLYVPCRQEGGAAYMAESWARFTGRTGVCFVTRGPGATNASIGVHTAAQGSTPMVLFIGQVSRSQRGLEAFQEIEYASFFDDLVKWVIEVDHPDDLPQIVDTAFTTAASDRPGPVVIALPEDVLEEAVSAEPIPPTPKLERLPSTDDLALVRTELEAAQRPVLLVGGGGWTSVGRAALATFAEAADLPVVVTFRRHDLFDNTCDHYVGEAGVGMPSAVRDTLSRADVVLALNCRFGEMTTSGYTLFGADDRICDQRITHIHPSASEFGKVTRPSVTVLAGPNAAAEALARDGLPEVEARSRWAVWRSDRRAAFKETLNCLPQLGNLDLGEVMAWLRDRLPDDVVVTNGAGNFSVWPNKFLLYGSDARLLAPQNGTMGYGLPAAVAAKIAEPSRTVICFAGDGDFQMNFQELGTALQLDARPIVLVVDNSSWGTIRMHQELRYPGRVSATDLVNPDFCAIAKAYGMHAERVESTEGFASAFERAMISATGALLHLVTAKDQLNPSLTVTDARSIGL